MGLQQRWQQHERGEVQHAVGQHQHQPQRVVPITQQAGTEEGTSGCRAVDNEDIESQRCQSGFEDNLARLVPIEPLAAGQHQLQATQSERQANEANPVEAGAGA